MRLLITGAAGFLGSRLVEYFSNHFSNIELIGIDNLSRKGSEHHLSILDKAHCKFIKGDIRCSSDIENIPKVDWIIDCAAEPSVLAGAKTPLDLLHNNLTGTFHLLEKCRKDQAGFILMSTSRVYSLQSLNKIKLDVIDHAFNVQHDQPFEQGFSLNGISEEFSTESPISLYGATKLASEVLSKEYHFAFDFPVFINRCGVIAGSGQLGRIDQGIFSYWIYRNLLKMPLSYIGYGGLGHQVRDCVHPYDIFTLIQMQLNGKTTHDNLVVNIGGGSNNSISLFQLNEYCQIKTGITTNVTSIAENRQFDIPFYVTDFTKAKRIWNWTPTKSSSEILDEIIEYGLNNISHIKSLFD